MKVGYYFLQQDMQLELNLNKIFTPIIKYTYAKRI